MKKNFTLVFLLMLLFAGTSWAQRAWEYDPTSVDEIEAGDGNYYVLQEGYNDKGQSENGFLNSSSENTLQQVNTSCIYSFIEVDEVTHSGQTFPVYVLKNVENGKYLTSESEKYTANMEKAFRFTARKGTIHEGVDLSDWLYYSNHMYYQECVDGGAWVLCSPTEQLYIGISFNPSFLSYMSTNNWYVYRAVERELTAYEKLNEVYSKYYPNGFDENVFPVGTTPGCISQELYNEMKAVYDEATALIADLNAAPAECDRLREAIIASFEKYEANVIPLSDGYYALYNRGIKGIAYDAGTKARADQNKAQPAVWTVADAKYIWYIRQSSKPGQYFIQSWSTGNYLGVNPGGVSPFPLVADSTGYFTATQFTGPWHILKDQNGATINRTAVGDLIRWNSTSENSQWRFDAIPADTIAKLAEGVNQNLLNKKLTEVLTSAKSDYFGLQTKSGITYDSEYADNAKGLVTEATVNSEDNTRPVAKAFDGDINSFFHSQWQADKAPQDDWHWMQVDLGREVSELVLKFSDRGDRMKVNMPLRFSLVAPEGDDLEAPMWMDTLSDTKVLPEYATTYSSGEADSTTTIVKVTLKRAARYLRFVGLETASNSIRGMGPCWNVSEIRFYDAADCVENPRFTMVPQETRDALKQAIDAATAELAAGTATQATIDALVAAHETFMAAYPDPTELTEALTAAQELLDDTSEEGQTPGYFQTGAKAAFQAVIDEISKEMEDKVLGIAEMEERMAKLSAAEHEFYGKMYVPEAGKVYRIVSIAGYDEDGDEYAMNNACLASENADINAATAWGYDINEDAEERFNTLWYLEKGENGYAFRNLANGFYMKNILEGMSDEELAEEIETNTSADARRILYSKTPSYFQFRPATSPENIMIALTDGQFVTLNTSGYAVRYFERTDHANQLQFVEITDDNGFVTSYKKDAKAGQAQIMTLPFEIGYVYTNNYTAMKVLGKKDGFVQLQAYADDETIPAGTPFVIVTDGENTEEGTSAENFVMIDLLNQSIEESLNLTYNYEPVEQNGLVSAPAAFELEAGYGYMYNSKVLISEGGETVEAGTGFFNSKLVDTEDEGEYMLELTGDITGEGTAVDGMEVIKNVPTDVYTISGVKIRSNVKASQAVKGLPKGIYVVGGKKVIVK